MQMYLAYLALLSIQAMIFRKNILLPIKKVGETVYVKKDATRFFLMLACIEVIIFTGLRGYTVGADTRVYLNAVEHYSEISFIEIFTAPLEWPYDFELGYFILTKIFAFSGLSLTVFLFFLAFVIYIPTFKYIYDYSTHPYISVLVYFAFSFFAYSLGIFRQFIAISIILCALKYIEQRRFWRFLIAVLFAMLFHTSALIVLPLYLFIKIDWRQKNLACLLVIAEAALIIVGRYVMQLAVILLPGYAGYFNDTSDLGSGSYINLIFLNVVFFAFWFAFRRSDRKNPTIDLLFSQLAMAILIQCCGYHMPIFGRVVPYFSMSMMIAIPYIIDGLGKKDKLLTAVLKTGACLVLFVLTLRNFIGNTYVCPFYFFWQEIPQIIP